MERREYRLTRAIPFGKGVARRNGPIVSGHTLAVEIANSPQLIGDVQWNVLLMCACGFVNMRLYPTNEVNHETQGI